MNAFARFCRCVYVWIAERKKYDCKYIYKVLSIYMEKKEIDD